jgi:DNA mismatch endonuclease (patch repair protein)
MRRNRARDTKAELLLRGALWRRGLRYRLHARELPGTPDIVFKTPKVAVFCDGDYWHGRNWKQRKVKLAKGHNASYWLSKIESNRKRDRRIAKQLGKLGWTVVRVWETEVLRDVEAAVRRVEAALVRGRRS